MEYYYLIQARKHAAFASSLFLEELLELYQRHVGEYGVETWWMENDQLFLKEEGIGRQILRPLSENRFMNMNGYSANYEFVDEAGEITAIRAYNHGFETEKWTLNPDWYYERTDLLN